MDTIYSKIIWGELGYNHETYKIHKEPFEKTEKLILDWIKDTQIERVNEVLFNELSYLDNITYETYYDGPFYGFNQREDEARPEGGFSEREPDILIHDSGMLPTILHMAIKTTMSPKDFEFLAKILTTYYEKIPEGQTIGWDWDHRNTESGKKL